MRKQASLRRRIAALLSVLVLATALAPGAAAAPTPSQPSALIHEESFRADRTLIGLFDSFTAFFQVGDWDIHEARLTLSLSATPLVRREVSDLTLFLNGRPFHSERIPLTGGEPFQTEISLPIDALTLGVNSLSLQSYLRTNETEPCAEELSRAAWLTVLKQSYVSLRYTPRAAENTVSGLYRAFSSIEALEYGQSALFLPPSPGEAALTAAGYLLSGISANAPLFYDRAVLLTAQTEEDLAQKSSGIYLCHPDRMLAGVRAALNTEQLEAAQEGVLMACISVKENSLLVVSSASDELLVKAGQLFGQRQLMEQLTEPWHALTPGELVILPPRESSARRRLTEQGAYVQGPFRQEASFSLQSDPGRTLKAGSEIELYFRYAENLDFDRSLVTVYLNGVPIGSKKLSRELANGDQLKLALPSGLGGRGGYTVAVAFDLEIKDLTCTLRQEETPWAYVTSESTATLLEGEAVPLLFDCYPGPLLSGGTFHDLTVVLPDEPGSADFTLFARVMSTLGRFLRSSAGSLRVCTESGMGNVNDRNLLVIGRYGKNALARQLNEQLFFPFTEDGTTLRSNEKLVISPGYGAALGSAQLLRSPYGSRERTLLLLTGVTDEGMLLTGDYLGQADQLWQLIGDGFLADGDEARFYRFKPENAKALSLFSADPSVVYAAAAVGAVVLLLLASAVMLAVRHRRRKED